MHRGHSRSAWVRGRRRLRSGRRGLVSVIATLFALLLLVLLISIFMLTPLAGQEQALETQHTLLVENQVAELQQALAFEGQHPSFPTTFTSPVTLGTTGVPPFGAATYGTLQVQGASAATADGLTITQVVPLNISWTPTLPSCNNCKLQYYNISVNGTSGGTISARGNAGFQIILNLLGENNSALDIDLRGNATTVYIIVGGSNNTLTFTNSGAPGTTNATFIFFGQHDTLDLSTYGRSGPVNAVFISKVGHSCPYANLSVQDHLLLPTSSVAGLNVTATWWNFIGYSNPLHQVTDPKTGFVYWNESLSGPTGCAFTKTTSVNYPLASSGSVLIHLANNYAPPADIAFEQGAVIESEGGGLPVMVEPPLISVSPFTPGGLSGKVTLFTFVGSPATQSGTGTAGISTHLLQKTELQLSSTGAYFFDGFRFSITTAYPAAWATYFASIPSAFPGGATCTTTGATPTVVSCLNVPTNGVPVLLKATMFVQSIDLTLLTLGVTFH